MHIRFRLGPAGRGKTYRGLAEIRAELHKSAEGLPLILLAPKQATFQLERQLLADDSLSGYTRLHILSFERLARFIFQETHQPPPRLLDEEGRLMVLRALLARRRRDLKLFRASARLAGFAQQLSVALRELQRNLLTPESLRELSAAPGAAVGLSLKLHDLALLLEDYLAWLREHGLQDADCLLPAATARLVEGVPFRAAGLWLDGFAEFSPQEMDLLAAVAGRCEQATLAFCLDQAPEPAAGGDSSKAISWLSSWSFAGKPFIETRARLGELPGAEVTVEVLPRDSSPGRFTGNPILAHLEKFWANPQPLAIHGLAEAAGVGEPASPLGRHLRAVVCANPEAEARAAAREIRRFVAAGGRYRDVAVILRTLTGYHEVLRRVFSRYDIPCFIDRREGVAHHPLAELTRSALRVVAQGWQHEDFFAALKSGLVSVEETLLDRLENEALARGWTGSVWQSPMQIPGDPGLSEGLEKIRRIVVPPFQTLAQTLAESEFRPTGIQLAEVLRALWRALAVEEQLQEWAGEIPNAGADAAASSAVHRTVWEQMNSWLDNVARAFPEEPLPLREWLPILEAGLGSLAVGVIPPALDQVLIGAVDRSRNPDIRLAVVMGLNEGVFPAPPSPAVLLTEADREELARRGVALGHSLRQHVGRERYFGYIACTRARQRLVLTCSELDAEGAALNPSAFWLRCRQMFPQLPEEKMARASDWRQAEHPVEVIAPLLKARNTGFDLAEWRRLEEIPALQTALDRLRHFRASPELTLSPAVIEQLYGTTLKTSVSRLEQYAACPFRFFVHSGLRAEERKRFELDVREQGSFQHDALKLFHEQLQAAGKRWRDITPKEARERMGKITDALIPSYRDGLLQSTEQTKFTARVMAGSLQDFVETLVGWMAGQYLFDPAAVELPFGETPEHPAWQLELGDSHRLALRGRIDRVDVFAEPGGEASWCVVLDYKSSAKKLDEQLVFNGLQLQLLAYLAVLRQWPDAAKLFGRAKLNPAGVFYVNLRGSYKSGEHRNAALAEPEAMRKLAYQHSGRFDTRLLPWLDARPGAEKGDQFNYRKTQSGGIHRQCRDPKPPAEFSALLDTVEANLVAMGRAIFAGTVAVSPYRKGSLSACQQCDYQSICRIDAWTHPFRSLKPLPAK
ncbi:MAG: PD-(D/E)XK nuclease family protein [Verrucomicrobiota bacterium]